MITKDSLTAFFKEKVTQPLGFREIVYNLNLTPPESRKLKRFLREMVNDGNIVRTRKGLYGLSEEMSLVTGYFEAHRDGYGFVILERPGERDVFIPARATLGAMDNDRVVARMENKHRREGRIIRILERAHARVAGTFETSRTGFYVKPKNRAVPFDLYIAPKERGKAKDGDSVIAEIISYPTDKRTPAGRIIKILKKPENPLDEVEGIIDELNLPIRFSHNAIEEAKGLYVNNRRAAAGGLKRKDLRHLPTITIDGERAKDFDDAISIEKSDNGYRLWVHIADVGHYVKWGSFLDAEARKRGTSVYFPDRVIPMLPKELSEDLCSLKPKVDRFAFTVEMDFDGTGERINQKFYPSIINSNERMTYTSVKEILIDEDKTERERYDYLLHDFEMMGELCDILKAGRLKRGSLDFDLPEPEVLLDIQGNPENIIRAVRNFAHMMIEEFMIAANEAVAGHLENLGIPSLYRIHEEPDITKLEDIMKTINTLGIHKGRKGMKARDFPGLLKQIQGTPEEDIISHMILRSLKQAKYSPVNVGHFGLASESYTHFTSPIRRYPDLVVHRILSEVLAKKHLGDKRIKELESILQDIAFHSSKMERQADDAERKVLDAMRVWFMKDKVGDEFEGKVVAVASHGLKIRLKDYYVEGFLHVSFMTDDFYQYDEKSRSLYGIHKKKRYAVGKEVHVRIDKVDMEEREIVLGI
ncbi:MAG: ribonuclease R [Nitrospirae bacterium GWC2_46_6]|nr:MAG: ribonuclease R [Nitrospirae bacterium GWA2_46_11]OGW22858.1 MAG: ribonuclease R [Nitrospirae bacterium GWC2_46_6]OGW24969.1 MAG: ribonuclease R [Nitrospirae bacterium GWB2_47_37]HAK88203.1 ribonuclease R [Nitrospiraceae bacterium]HCZ11735.1 ribonuclease R [Nitrospiraceae bacterium]